MGKLILLRHGQSMWNLHNLFTGWVDIPLSPKGINEALEAGEKMANIRFDMVYVSTLQRAMQTALLALSKNKNELIATVDVTPEELGKEHAIWTKMYSDDIISKSLPVKRAWQLNERYYGELQGLNKDETAKKYGADQVKIWRRSYDVPPPNGESLKDTVARTIPFYTANIEPMLAAGKTILIAAHGNSLRSIAMSIEKLSPEQVLQLEIGTGEPIEYKFESGVYTKIGVL